MNLSDYLSQPGITQSKLATSLGVSQGLVHQWASGKTRITAERAIAIEAATDGLVTKYDLRPDIFGAPQQPPPDTATPDLFAKIANGKNAQEAA
jgi:transcriptional regulator with XRE-family HTH domain